MLQKMNHSYFKDRISAYFDNELKNEEQALIAEHLKECKECQELLEQLDKFDRLVEKHSGLKETDYWEQTAQKIEQATETETETEVTDIKQPSWKGLGWKFTGVAASLGIIAFIALYQRDITEEVQQTIRRAPSAVFEEALRMDSIAPGEDEKKMMPADEIARESRPRQEETIQKPGRSEFESKPSLTEQSADIVFDEDVVAPGDAEIRAKKKRLAPPKAKLQVKTTADEGGPRPEELPIVKLPYEVASSETVGPVTGERDEPVVVDTDVAALAEEPTGDRLLQFTLEQWRNKRDSLAAISSELTAFLAQKSGLPQKETVISTAKKTKAEIEKLLLECYYYIAQLTDDETEYQASLQFLEEYSRNENLANKDVALNYLRILRAGKTGE